MRSLSEISGRVIAVFTRPGALRVEAMRILLLLREKFYLGVIGLAVRRLRQKFYPSRRGSKQEEALESMAAAIKANTEAVDRLAEVVNSLASAHGAMPPVPSGGLIAAALASSRGENATDPAAAAVPPLDSGRLDSVDSSAPAILSDDSRDGSPRSPAADGSSAAKSRGDAATPTGSVQREYFQGTSVVRAKSVRSVR